MVTTYTNPTASADTVEHGPMGIRIHVLKGVKEFKDLRAEWDELYKRAAKPHHVFQSHTFLRHWIECYLGDEARLVVICGWLKNQLAMVWPLVIRRKMGVDIVTFMGAPVAQFFDVLVEDHEERSLLLNEGWKALLALEADVFVGNNIRQDTLIHSCEVMSPVELPGRTTAPYAMLSIRVDGEDPGRAYSARERSNYRRRLRRAGDFGQISFSSLQPGAEASVTACKAISFKNRSLLKKSIWSPTVSDPKFRLFFERLATDPDAALRVSTINCDGTEIGVELSFDCNGHTFGHVLATDPDKSLEGIGSVLILRAFISAAARGTHTFEMMAPADQYKMRHADGEISVSHLAVAFTMKGRLYRDIYLKNVQPVAKIIAKMWVSPIVARRLRARSAID